MVKSSVLPTLTSKITSSIGGSWWVPLKNWFPSHPAEAWYTAPLLSISGRSFRSGSSTSQAAAASDDVSGATKTWGRRHRRHRHHRRHGGWVMFCEKPMGHVPGPLDPAKCPSKLVEVPKDMG